MGHIIEDGTGDSYKLKIDEENRAHVSAVQESRFSHMVSEHELGFICNTGFISLTTTSSFNGMIYLKNISSGYIARIERLRICGTAAATGFGQVEFVKNPTAGTLISEASAVTRFTNAVFSSVEAMTTYLTAYKASGDSKTITDGTIYDNLSYRTPGHTEIQLYGAVVLKRNDAVAIQVKPAASGIYCCQAFVFMEAINSH